MSSERLKGWASANRRGSKTLSEEVATEQGVSSEWGRVRAPEAEVPEREMERGQPSEE